MFITQPETEPIIENVVLPSARSVCERQTVAAVIGAEKRIQEAYSMENALDVSA